MDAPNFDEMAKALEASALHEKTVNQIMTLAVEYDAGTITSARFADRVVEIIRQNYTKFVKSA